MERLTRFILKSIVVHIRSAKHGHIFRDIMPTNFFSLAMILEVQSAFEGNCDNVWSKAVKIAKRDRGTGQNFVLEISLTGRNFVGANLGFDSIKPTE